MKNATETPAQVNNAVNPVVDAVNAETLAQANALSTLVKASGSIGALGLEKLAQEMGESTSKAGRPSFAAWAAFVFALSSVKPGYAAQNRLIAIANKHVPADHKPVAKAKAKGEIGKAACSYRLNSPVAWEIAIGE